MLNELCVYAYLVSKLKKYIWTK